MGLLFFNEEGSIVMGSPIWTLEVMGLADGQHDNLRDSPMADEINSQILKRPKARTKNIQNPRKLGEVQSLSKDKCNNDVQTLQKPGEDVWTLQKPGKNSSKEHNNMDSRRLDNNI